jgi:hypothetical protein
MRTRGCSTTVTPGGMDDVVDTSRFLPGSGGVVSREHTLARAVRNRAPVRLLITLGILIKASMVQAAVSVEIDLSTQTGWILQEGQRVYQSPISSGRAGHETPSGDFAILEKDREHHSTPYRKLVAADGSILKADADCARPVPQAAKFEPAPMKWFARFSGPVGMHAGHLPGHPASHGCVRLPGEKARLFYDIVTLGTPVRVSGSTPERDEKSVSGTTTLVAVTPLPKRSAATGWFSWFRGSPESSALTNSEKEARLGANSEPRKIAR